jgi:hypothetical protein
MSATDRDGNAIDLPAILEAHKRWCDGSVCDRANLSRADLSGAYLSGANLSGANLSDAYLSDAYLSDAYLSGANLSGANLRRANLSDVHGYLCVVPCDGWAVGLCEREDGSHRIYAGCRDFDEKEARAHWNADHTGGLEHAARMIAGVDALLALAKAHGWPS